MQIRGLQKLTLLDFPERLACTVFLGGCNFRCPFCHNASLVMRPSECGEISEEELFSFLEGRRGKLAGVCITGGEPTLYPTLPTFISKIRALGFAIKLDTNGSMYDKLVAIVNEGLCDYVAMDVKSSPNGYNIACGGMVNVDNVLKSIAFLIAQNKVDYEFRTTVVKQLHSKQDFEEIASLLKGCKRYFLQQYKHSHKVIKEGYSAYSEVEMKELCEIVKGFGINCALRGIDG